MKMFPFSTGRELKTLDVFKGNGMVMDLHRGKKRGDGFRPGTTTEIASCVRATHYDDGHLLRHIGVYLRHQT